MYKRQAKVLLDRGWGKPKEMRHSEVDDNKTLLKVVNEIVHVYETREQIEFNDQTPLLEINPSKNGGNTCGPPSARLDLKPPRSRGRIRDHLFHRHRCQWQGREGFRAQAVQGS